MLSEPISAAKFVRLCVGIYPTAALCDYLRENDFGPMLASPEFWLDDLAEYLDEPEPEPKPRWNQEL